MTLRDHIQGRVLVICPAFFSYHTAICGALVAAGCEVVWWDDRATDAPAYKAALRLMPRAMGRLSARSFAAQLREAGPRRFDHVLVVKGEAVTPEVIELIRTHSPEASLSLYMWDASDNVRNSRRFGPLFDRVSTFDPLDAERYGWRYRPLFSTRGVIKRHGQGPATTHDWAFVGTLHSDRHRVLDRIRRQNANLRGVVRGYVPGRAMMWARCLADWTLVLAPRGTISHRPWPASEVAEVVGRASAVVDIEHPRQRGLTIRTIETLLDGRKLITTNANVRKSDLYDPSRVQVIDRQHPAISLEFIAAPFKPIPQELASRYLLPNWLADVMTGGPRGEAKFHPPARRAR